MLPFIGGAIRAVPYIMSAVGALGSLGGVAAKQAVKAAPRAAKQAAVKVGRYAKNNPVKTAGAVGLGYVSADALGRMMDSQTGPTQEQLSAIQQFKELAARQSGGTGFPFIGNQGAINGTALRQAAAPAANGIPPLSAPLPAQMPSVAAINDAALTQLTTAGALGNYLAKSMVDHYNEIKARNLSDERYSIAPGFYQAIGSLGGALQRSAQALPNVAQVELARVRTPVELANARMQARAALLNADANTLNARGNYMYRTSLANTLPAATYIDMLGAQANMANALSLLPPDSPLMDPMLGALGYGNQLFYDTIGSRISPQ